MTSKATWNEIKPKSDISRVFHIEIFHAVHGKSQELIKQRKMENKYLTLTYKDMMEFASMLDLASNLFSKAAFDAKFKSRDDIGLYLRELISTHFDTIAINVE